ncbi:MAG: DUF309 domain-containing protein [Candidatus Omnitrophica bacterium]|nr:DUF309 domain-containing protein [Candidatus Omnitrophota bacterium]MDE2009860.1 DUF309 domain-containing protein [Candidatus Omnitrophota bacterium]MDE2214358.1 DUF309 domain-containing protein [Candidatus Omnitrophota bacterium]MDE2231107.1 DUF309 domain-containing protein [Candidatus Omnitrophota bacterium]
MTRFFDIRESCVPLHRYTSKAFPAYRFIPGENPHPTENPAGHSYSKTAERKMIFDPELWSEDQGYLYGVDLYNNGYWWEAHEAFEERWRVVDKGNIGRDYLQGLIKISGAFIKWHLRKLEGSNILYKEGIAHLLKVMEKQECYMGLHLSKYIVKLEDYFTVITRNSVTALLCVYPYILLNED